MGDNKRDIAHSCARDHLKMHRVATGLPSMALTAGALASAIVFTCDGAWVLCVAAAFILMIAVATGTNIRRGIVYAATGIIATAISSLALRPDKLEGGYETTHFIGVVSTLAEGRAGLRAVVDDGHYRIGLVTDQGINLRPGDIIELEGIAEPVDKYGDIPFMHTQELVSKADRLSAKMTISSGHIRIVGHDDGLWFRLQSLRDDIAEAVYSSSLSNNASSLLVASCLGSGDARVGIKERFRAIGLSHLLCVSGFHVAIVTWLLAIVLWPFKIWVEAGRMRYLLMVVGVWLFVFLTGIQPSAIRAALMITAFYAGRLLQRDSNPFNSLILAVGLMIIYNPYWLYSIGFQLSVTAVAGLLAFANPLNPIPERYPMARKAAFLFTVPLAAMAGTAPVVLFWFHRLPLLSVPVNALATILFPLFLTAGFIAVLFNSTAATRVADTLCDSILNLCERAASGSEGLYDNIFLSTSTLAGLAIFIISMGFFIHIRHTWIKAACVSAAMIAMVACIHPADSAATEVLALSDIRGSRLILRQGSQCSILRSGNGSHKDISDYMDAYCIDSIMENPNLIICLDGKTIGMASSKGAGHYRCDILLVDGSFKGDYQALLDLHRPEMVLIGANTPIARVDDLTSLCESKNICIKYLAKKAAVFSNDGSVTNCVGNMTYDRPKFTNFGHEK